MKVAMLSLSASPLGAQGILDADGLTIHVAELSGALAARGHEVRVYTRRDDELLPERVELRPGVDVEHVTAGPATRLADGALLTHVGDFGRAVGARLRDFQPDVVHAHHWMSGLAALQATAEHRIPVVETYHSLGSVERRFLRDADPSPATRVGLERTLGGLVDRVVAQSDDEVAELARLGVPRASTVIVPSGVDADHFTPAGPAVTRPGGLRRVLSVGRVVPRRGYADLVDAVRLVPGAELVVLGAADDDQAAGIRGRAEKAGVADRVRLAGAVHGDELPRWYRSADVVACAAWYEPFGLTPLEAMACGVPVVAYAVGGMAETVIDDVTGVLVRPRDVRHLAGALRGLLGDDVRRMSYASAAVDRVRSRYTWERTAEGIERVYLAVTGADVEEDAVLSLPHDQG
jgi:glycosyltransferase involved in cell wall biosynthesis